MFHNLRIKIHSLKSKIMSSQFTFLSVSILYSVSNEVQFFNRGLHPVHQFFCLVEFRWQENFNYDCNPTTTLHLLLSFFGLPTVAVRFECPRNALFSKKKKKKNALTTMLFNVSFRSALGRDGGELQLARRTSPGSYRLCSVHRVGPLSGSSGNKREGVNNECKWFNPDVFSFLGIGFRRKCY